MAQRPRDGAVKMVRRHDRALGRRRAAAAALPLLCCFAGVAVFVVLALRATGDGNVAPVIAPLQENLTNWRLFYTSAAIKSGKAKNEPINSAGDCAMLDCRRVLQHSPENGI